MNSRVLAVALLVIALAACGGGGNGNDGGGDGSRDTGTRSLLFPEDWTPDTTDAEGRFLHDFSWAGYRNGEASPPDLADAAVFDVAADHGADPTGQSDSTAAFQSAIDAAETAGGGVVFVPAGLYRLDGLLSVARSGIVLRGTGPESSRLYFTRHDGMTGRNHVTFSGPVSTGREYPLVVDGAARTHEVFVDDASGLSPGDDVSVGFVITDAFVVEHGMTGVWQAFNATWQPMCRREVVQVDTGVTPNRVLLDVPLRQAMALRDQASLRVETGYLSEVGVERLGLANAVAWDAAWTQERVHVLGFAGVKDAWIRDVASFASPPAPTQGAGAEAHLQNGGILVRDSKRVTIADCRMEKAQHRGGGGCGYLFEIMRCSEILTRECVGLEGRHNFIQNWGFGTSGCVWLRCRSAGGLALFSQLLPTVGSVGHSEFHHSLATANLIDSCTVDDGWSALNRQQWSSGAGHTATQCVFWNTTGGGEVRSGQYGWGYVIGTGPELAVNATLIFTHVEGADPEDWTEAIGGAGTLEPQSLYEAQFLKRTGRSPE